MILFVDTYLSEVALSPNKKLASFLSDVQDKSYAYRKQSKIDIFRYSLASYACLSWSKVIVRVSGDEASAIEALVPYIRDLFPEAEVALTRSDTGSKYAQALEMAGSGDPWVFFSPNNDHPFIHHDTRVFEPLRRAAELAEKRYGYPTSIFFSHFTEALNSINPDKFLYGYTGDFCEILCEDDASYTVKYKHLSLLSLQIFRRSHLIKLMKSAGDRRVVRTECLGQYNDYQTPTVVIIPKEECCRHYDAYMHTAFVVRDFITASMVPPLFIPDGFFAGEIKIRYGYGDYSKEFVNINPKNRKYIFDSSDGVDLAISLDRMPAFWRSRIVEVESNPKFNDVQDNLGSTLALDVVNPWRRKTMVEIRMAVLYRRVFYSALGSCVRKFLDRGKNLLRLILRAVQRGRAKYGFSG
jgi:hypothetical protein